MLNRSSHQNLILTLTTPLRFAAFTATLILVSSGCSPGGGAAVDDGAGTSVPPPVDTTAPTEAFDVPGLVVVPPGGADMYSRPGSATIYRAAQGLIFPVLADDGAWLQVLTTCNTEEWVRIPDVEPVSTTDPGMPGPGFDLSEAVIVIDPGHGGRDLGAVGESGTHEKDVNLAIASMLRDRLTRSQDIDWETGRIRAGEEYPAVASVLMTRDPDGPAAGDVELGLAYRAGLSNGAGASALVSIHNNTSHARIKDTPGSDVYYSVSSPDSDRLASLIHEELISGLRAFGDQWGSGKLSGPRARVDQDTGDDFYGLLRRADASSVIVEGMYISNPAEELLLQSELVRMAYADAVYRGLVRFLTSDAVGSEILEPDPFAGAVGTPSTSSCEVPVQP